MSLFDGAIVGAVSFGRTVVGLVTKPYETYRRITDRASWFELLPIALTLCLYFALASAVRVSHFRPYFLTKEFIVLFSGAGLTFLVVVGLLWLVGHTLGGKGDIRGLTLAWAYTLLPTVLWFLLTSILYVLFPPPRTIRLQGIVFSILYLIISSVLFFWKLMLGYLTLRFAFRFDLKKILVTAAIVSPILVSYSFLMYKLGIFRVPFI